MTYPNAYKGVKKIYAAEMLVLLASIAANVAGIIIDNAEKKGTAPTGTLVTVLAALGIGAGILVIIGGIMNLVGLSNASKDDDYFKKGFAAAIVSLVVSVVASFLPELKITSPMINDLCKTVSSICEILVTFYVIAGIKHLAEQLNNPNMVSRGSKAFTVFAVAQIAGSLLGLLGNVLPKQES